MKEIMNHVRESKNQETMSTLRDIISQLNYEGYAVEFGTIGSRTTYALLTNPEKDVEIVGYTFIKNMKYYNEATGKLKALQQAVARKELARKEE